MTPKPSRATFIETCFDTSSAKRIFLKRKFVSLSSFQGSMPVFRPEDYLTTTSIAVQPAIYGSVKNKYGGAKGDRTPDLLRARQALSQLSYSPIIHLKK